MTCKLNIMTFILGVSQLKLEIYPYWVFQISEWDDKCATNRFPLLPHCLYS